MANYASLKAAIQQVVKTNGNNEITGALLQQTLFAMVNSLGADYLFVGIAQPSTNPGTPDQNVFYIAGPGTYPNFNGAVIADGRLGVLKYNGAWTLETAPVGKDYSGDIDELKLRQIPLHISLPMIEKTSQLITVNRSGYDYTPELISAFLLDMKLEGTPEAGKIYDLAFQIQKTGTVAWANYLYLYKRNANGTSQETIGTFQIGTTMPTGIMEYSLTINDTHITKCRVLLDYRAMKDIADNGTYAFVRLYQDAGYRFNQEYLFDNITPSELNKTKVKIGDIKPPQILTDSALASYPAYESLIKELYISKSIISDNNVDRVVVTTVNNNELRVIAQRNGSNVFYCNVPANTTDVQLLKVTHKYSIAITVAVGDCVGFVQLNSVQSLPATVGSGVVVDFNLISSISAFSGRTDSFVLSFIEANKDYIAGIIPLPNPNTRPFTQFGLPMINKEIELPTITRNSFGEPVGEMSATKFSRFLLDMKLVGTPEENTQYRFDYFQHRVNTGGQAYANFIRIVKSSDNWATQTAVVQNWVGATPPSGIVLHEFTPTSSTLSKIRLLLNWDAIADLDTNVTVYGTYSIPTAYKFEMSYLTNQEYGIIPNIDAFRGIANVQTIVEQIAAPIISDALNYGMEIQLPNVLYAVVGTEMNLWNDAIAYSMDKGLQSPMNYSVSWYSTVGTITNRCFRFTPEASQAGNTYTLTCYLFNTIGQLVAQKTVQIKVKAQNALTQSKRIVFFGDSLGPETARYLYNDFNNSGKFTGTIPTMLGTKGNPNHYEAVGGYRWADYATKGRRAFRCQISNFTESIGLNSTYTNNGFTWTVIEVNVSGGTGNILITKQDISGSDAPLTNGNLVSTGSYATIPYTDAQLEGANPLWNESTEQLDVALYRQRLGLATNEKLDAVSFQFGINDNGIADNLPLLLSYIQALYNAFIADNPNCLFIVGLTTTSGNDANGSGANYGASFPTIQYNHRVFVIRSFYLTLQNNADMPNLRVAPIAPQIDRYFGYNFATRQISQRYTETEQYHNNYVHPGASGYGQLGDAYFAAYVGALTE